MVKSTPPPTPFVPHPPLCFFPPIPPRLFVFSPPSLCLYFHPPVSPPFASCSCFQWLASARVGDIESARIASTVCVRTTTIELNDYTNRTKKDTPLSLSLFPHSTHHSDSPFSLSLSRSDTATRIRGDFDQHMASTCHACTFLSSSPLHGARRCRFISHDIGCHPPPTPRAAMGDLYRSRTRCASQWHRRKFSSSPPG